MANNPPRYEVGQHGALEVGASAVQQRPNRLYQRIEIMIDFPPEDTHRRSPFFRKNRNGLSLAVIALDFALSRFAWSSGLARSNDF
jgi:hypothetical protein